jgi:3-oxoacyl-[acyl-carrier protein] reductase
MILNFQGKIAVVTGGTRGLGSCIARELEDCGAEVIITGTNELEICTLNEKREPKSKRTYVTLDLTQDRSVDGFCQFLTTLPRIDICINNAGVNRSGTISNLTPEDWDYVHRVNVRGPMQIMNSVVPTMIKHGYGRIVSIGSIYAEITDTARISSSSSRAGLLGLTRAAAIDLAGQGIVVNAVSPGFLDTESTRKRLSEEQRKIVTESIPLGRLADPDELASVVLMLAHSSNTQITGQNIIVDGGYSLL